MMNGLGDLASVVVQADPADEADVYRELGLRLTYRPQKQLVEAKVIPGPDRCDWYVSEGRHEPNAHAFVLTQSFLLGGR